MLQGFTTCIKTFKNKDLGYICLKADKVATKPEEFSNHKEILRFFML